MYRDICHLNRRVQLFGPLCLALGLEAAIVAGIGPPSAHADAGAESDSSRPAEKRFSVGQRDQVQSWQTVPDQHQPKSSNRPQRGPRSQIANPHQVLLCREFSSRMPPQSHRRRCPRFPSPPSQQPADSCKAHQPLHRLPLSDRTVLPEVPAYAPSITPAIAPAVAVAAPGKAIIARAANRTPPLEASSTVTVASPPAASASLGAAISGLLSSLSIALSGGQPTAPADASVALLWAAGRSVRTSRSQTSPATENVVSTAPAASTDSTPTTTVEAEDMTSSSGVRVVFDRKASSSYALALSGSGTASTTVALAESTALTIRVKSSQGAPDMTLSIDGETVTTLLVEARSYADYMFAGKIAEDLTSSPSPRPRQHHKTRSTSTAWPLRPVRSSMSSSVKAGAAPDPGSGQSEAAPVLIPESRNTWPGRLFSTARATWFSRRNELGTAHTNRGGSGRRITSASATAQSRLGSRCPVDRVYGPLSG